MLLGEPNRTQFDLHFELLGIPVRVHPFFWLAGLILGARGEVNGLELLIWLAVFFFSILVHEMGHALMMRRFGLSSHVVLYMMGGLAIPDSFGSGGRGSRSREWVLISAAGPGAGFLLAGLVVLFIIGSGGEFTVNPAGPIYQFWSFNLSVPYGPESEPWYQLIDCLLFVNIFWGLINLAPVYPLDGGQIARQLLVDKDPWNGVVKSLWVSVIAGGCLVLLGLSMGRDGLFMAILFGLLAVQSYMAIQQLGGGGFGGGGFGGGRRW